MAVQRRRCREGIDVGFQPGEDLQHRDRVTAEGEEVVVRKHRVDADHVTPHVGEEPLGRRQQGAPDTGRPGSGTMGRGGNETGRVHFADRGQRHLVDEPDLGRHHEVR